MMALEIKKLDISKSADKEVDFLTGINSFMGTLNKVIDSASSMLGKYESLKSSLSPKGSQFQNPQGAYRQTPRQSLAIPEHPPEKAMIPEPMAKVEPKQEEKEEVNSMEDKKVKAEQLYNELCELAKPYLAVMDKISALQVFQYVKKPANKEKLINSIAGRL